MPTSAAAVMSSVRLVGRLAAAVAAPADIICFATFNKADVDPKRARHSKRNERDAQR